MTSVECCRFSVLVYSQSCTHSSNPCRTPSVAVHSVPERPTTFLRCKAPYFKILAIDIAILVYEKDRFFIMCCILVYKYDHFVIMCFNIIRHVYICSIVQTPCTSIWSGPGKHIHYTCT